MCPPQSARCTPKLHCLPRCVTTAAHRSRHETTALFLLQPDGLAAAARTRNIAGIRLSAAACGTPDAARRSGLAPHRARHARHRRHLALAMRGTKTAGKRRLSVEGSRVGGSKQPYAGVTCLCSNIAQIIRAPIAIILAATKRYLACDFPIDSLFNFAFNQRVNEQQNNRTDD